MSGPGEWKTLRPELQSSNEQYGDGGEPPKPLALHFVALMMVAAKMT